MFCNFCNVWLSCVSGGAQNLGKTSFGYPMEKVGILISGADSVFLPMLLVTEI